MKLHIFKYFKDTSCYDKVRENANRSTTTESTTIEKNISPTQLATNSNTTESTTIEKNISSTQLASTGRPISSTEFTTVERIHSTRQDNATSNRDKEYVIIKQLNLLLMMLKESKRKAIAVLHIALNEKCAPK